MAPTATTDAPTYQSQMGDLASLDPQGLRALRDKIAAAFEDADSHNDTDGMTQAADANDAVQARAQELGVDLDNLPEQQAPADDAAPAADQAPVAAAEAETQPEEDAVDAPPTAPERQPLAMAASGVTITAGADLPGISAGTQFNDRAQFVQAMTDKIESLRGALGQGDKVIVATARAPKVPDERHLTGDPADFEKIQAVVGRDAAHVKALVASGGYCAPLEPRYEVFGIGVTDRPVRGALPGFRANRGGITYITPPKLSGLTGASGVWTATTDASPGGATKAKLVVGCGSPVNVSISAITLQMQFGNFVARAYPEMVERNTELGMIGQARLAETTLLNSMASLSTAVTSSANAYGVARDWLIQVAQGAVAYRVRHRMAEDTPMRVIAPAWLRDAIRDDIALSKTPTGDDVLGISDGNIDSWLSARNIQVAWHLDDAQLYAPQFAGALNLYPTTVKWFLFAEGSFLFLDGGTLDIGIVRDSTLVGTNDYIQFSENFETVAFIGVESYLVTSTFSSILQGKTGN